MKRESSPYFALLLAIGCEDPLKHGQRLEEARILGARVVSETGEASLTPGAGATVELLMAGPGGPVDARVAFEFCEAVASDRGVPRCARQAFAEGVVDTLSSPITLSIPEGVPAGARLAFLGVACEAGEPSLTGAPLDWNCTGDHEPSRFSFDASTRTPTFTHRNPDLAELLLEIAGAEVPLDDPRSPPSCADGVPVVAARTAQRVEWRLGPGAREPGDAGGAGESLQVSHFSTSGHFERQLSFVDEVDEPVVRLSWEAPAVDVPAKLYLVVRDGRGGVSWVSASVCAR
jgi:hypothetical protein